MSTTDAYPAVPGASPTGSARGVLEPSRPAGAALDPAADTAMDTPGRLLTAEDLAQRWQLPTSWIYAATRDGRIPAVRLGRYRRFRVSAIEAFEADGGVDG